MSSTGIFIISSILVSSLNEIDTEYNWLIHLLLNVITYGTVILPGVLTFIFIKQTNYHEKSGKFYLIKIYLFSIFTPIYFRDNKHTKNRDV